MEIRFMHAHICSSPSAIQLSPVEKGVNNYVLREIHRNSAYKIWTGVTWLLY